MAKQAKILNIEKKCKYRNKFFLMMDKWSLVFSIEEKAHI